MDMVAYREYANLATDAIHHSSVLCMTLKACERAIEPLFDQWDLCMLLHLAMYACKETTWILLKISFTIQQTIASNRQTQFVTEGYINNIELNTYNVHMDE